MITTIVTRHSKNCAHRDDPTWKRCNCWKHLRWFVKGVNHFQSTRSRTWQGAEDFKVQWDRDHGPKPVTTVLDPINVSMRDAVKTFIENKKGENISEDFLNKYTRELERLCTFLEKQTPPVFQLHQVTLPVLTIYRGTWKGLYPRSNTRSKVQERMKGFFKWAMLAYNLPRSPALGLKAIKTSDTPDTMPLTPEEYLALLDAVPKLKDINGNQKKLSGLVQLQRHSGLAIGDALSVDWINDIQEEDGETFIIKERMKTGTLNVRIPLPPYVADLLREIMGKNPRFVFWPGTMLPGKQTITKNYQKLLRKLWDHAQIDNGDIFMRSHRLRDTAAVEWLKLGYDLYAVSKMLGHKSIKTTEKHYAKWVLPLQKAAEQRLIATWRKALDNAA